MRYLSKDSRGAARESYGRNIGAARIPPARVQSQLLSIADPLRLQRTMPQTPHIEKHFTASETARDIVIGMSDSLTVPFALAAGRSGAVESSSMIVTAGLAEVAAGAIAMGLFAVRDPDRLGLLPVEFRGEKCALMPFHAARLDAPLDEHGGVLLLEDQDRDRWDQALIGRALMYLQQSAEGTVISPFHLEAGIAVHHCTATSYAETNWAAILQLYDALIRIHRSPVYLLNRAIVVAQIEGPEAGIRALDDAGADSTIRRYQWFDATLGELHRRAGNLDHAREHLKSAYEKAMSSL
jgi:hypothetical protein